jgi:hypothetical protein
MEDGSPAIQVVRFDGTGIHSRKVGWAELEDTMSKILGPNKRIF